MSITYTVGCLAFQPTYSTFFVLNQCEVEGGVAPVGSLPSYMDEAGPNNLFPRTAGALDALNNTALDRCALA